jgi:hypothetical protein
MILVGDKCSQEDKRQVTNEDVIQLAKKKFRGKIKLVFDFFFFKKNAKQYMHRRSLKKF